MFYLCGRIRERISGKMELLEKHLEVLKILLRALPPVQSIHRIDIEDVTLPSIRVAHWVSLKAPESITPMCNFVLYCIVSIHLYSASCSAHQSEALPVRETQREESSLERTKRVTWLTS